MVRMKMRRRAARLLVLDGHRPVGTDWKYWAEHVVHWHAVLVAIVAVLAVGYLFFNQRFVLAARLYTGYPQ